MTNQEIEQLQIEAGEHGDEALIATCQAALDGDEAARARCERVIAEARALRVLLGQR